MAEQGKPRISNITKYFIPGLALGILVGGICGAYLGPRLEQPSLTAISPPPTAPTARKAPRPEVTPPAPEVATGATGQTGASAASGETSGTGAAPK